MPPSRSQIDSVLCTLSWSSFFKALKSSENERAFAMLQTIWTPAWKAASATDAPSATLGFLALCKAMISFKCGMYTISENEVSHAVHALRWKGTDDIWRQMSVALMSLDASWEVLQNFTSLPRYPLHAAPFALVAVCATLLIEILISRRDYPMAIERLHLFQQYLENVKLTPAFRFGPPGPGLGWNECHTYAESCHIRAVEVLLADQQGDAARALLGKAPHSPALELLRVKVAIRCGRHEEGVQILHKMSQTSPVVTKVGRAFMALAVDSTDAGTHFQEASQLFSEGLGDAKFAQLSLLNNAACALIHSGHFVDAFVSLYGALSTFLPIGVTGDTGNDHRSPGLDRIPVSSMQNVAFIPMFVPFRNATLMNEFIAQTTARNQMLRDLVTARGVQDRDVLALGLLQDDTGRVS